MGSASAAHVASHLSLLVETFPSLQTSARSTLHQTLLEDLENVTAWGTALACEVRLPAWPAASLRVQPSI